MAQAISAQNRTGDISGTHEGDGDSSATHYEGIQMCGGLGAFLSWQGRMVATPLGVVGVL